MDLITKNRFSRKKKVIDGSKRRGNVVGFFTSNKMGCAIHYQSLAECNFLYSLELDPRVKEYYVQPLNVPVVVGKVDDRRHWPYTPDVLVFYDDGSVKLFEVKYSKEEINEPQQLLRAKAAQAYCRQEGWEYEVICPNDMDPVFLKNCTFLNQFIHPRDGLENFEKVILSTVGSDWTPIKFIAEKVAEQTGEEIPAFLPHIYHLIANVKLEVVMDKGIDINSIIRLSRKNANLINSKR